MQRGIIKFLNFEKGFGFIEADEGPDVFFHAKQQDADERDLPRLGIPIYYDARPGSRGPVAFGWRFTPRPAVVIDSELDRREGFRPGVLIRYRWSDHVLLGTRRGDWTWLTWACHGWPDHPSSPDWMFSYGVPQGGIEPGESCEDAIRRELDEELGEYEMGWTHNIDIRFLFAERSPFSFEKDGRLWRGKSLYAFDVVGQIPEQLWDLLLGNNRDEEHGSPLPTPAFEGGIYFYKPAEAKELIQTTQRGAKGAQLIRLLEAE